MPVKLIRLSDSGHEEKSSDRKSSTEHRSDIVVPLTRRSPAFKTKRNKQIVKAYRAGFPRKYIAKRKSISERQIANILNKMSTSSQQRQQWYDEHEENAQKHRTGRQHTQRRFRPG